MDVPTFSTFLRPILTVTTVWNTGGTGDIHRLGVPFYHNLPKLIHVQDNLKYTPDIKVLYCFLTI